MYKQLCIAKSEFNLNDRCLAVLSSLLSFLPDDQISANNQPVVFPSNRQLSLRAHGMPESTLRRHLSTLINAGIIARKDSPNCKRYAHKDGAGAVELAFGFSFAPLIERAPEIAQKAETILARQRALKMLRDEVSVARREIAAKFETADQTETLSALFCRFRTIVDTIPRRASAAELNSIKANFEAIHSELTNLLENNENDPEISGTAAQSERHYYESPTESLLDSKNVKLNDLTEKMLETDQPASSPVTSSQQLTPLPLDMVLRSCPDITAYAAHGINCWRDLLNAASVVSSFLGIAENTWREAAVILGREGASTVVAWILQRADGIKSPGGYLHSLIYQAKNGQFELTSLLSVK
ncbi:replication initiation protein [Brucella sp. NBRC 12950]|nr:replication initiation protein [Brucella sp. NBRC 12950]